MTIKQHCIPRDVWIDHYGNNGSRSEILMKLVSTEYDDDLKDWDMNRIKQVEKTYSKVSRGIQYRKQELLGDIPGPSALASTAPVDTLFNEPVAKQARTLVRCSNPPCNKDNHCLNSNLLCYKTCAISKTFVINRTIATNWILGYSNTTKDTTTTGNIYNHLFKDNISNLGDSTSSHNKLKANISNHGMLLRLQLIHPTLSMERNQLPPPGSISRRRQVKTISRSRKLPTSPQSMPLLLRPTHHILLRKAGRPLVLKHYSMSSRQSKSSSSQ